MSSAPLFNMDGGPLRDVAELAPRFHDAHGTPAARWGSSASVVKTDSTEEARASGRQSSRRWRPAGLLFGGQRAAPLASRPRLGALTRDSLQCSGISTTQHLTGSAFQRRPVYTHAWVRTAPGSFVLGETDLLP